MNFTTFYLFLCIIFAGRGDERWKKRTTDDTDKVIGELNEAADLERDLWPYENNFDAAIEKEFYRNAHLKELKHKHNNQETLYKTKLVETEKQSIIDNFLSDSIYITRDRIKNTSKDLSNDFNKFKRVKDDSKEAASTIPKWPKFEELLLSFGVEYDWKSDRWIKLKGKLKMIPDKTNKKINNEATHQKHEFKYRTVRINGSKRRKNIIIALTAIR